MSADDFGGLEFVNEEHKQFFLEAHLGEEFRQFMQTDVGRLLYGRSKQQYEDAKQKLLQCNPDSIYGRRKARKYRFDAEVADCFIRWVAEAIGNGDEARKMVTEIEKNNY